MKMKKEAVLSGSVQCMLVRVGCTGDLVCNEGGGRERRKMRGRKM
jgi:hypothetical protein